MTRGLLAVLGALLCLSHPGASPGQGGVPSGAVMDIAPIEADIEAMRRTLRSLETLVDERSNERIGDLISPRVTEHRRRSITGAVEEQIRSMPPGARFTLRTDIGRGAVVPVGPGRVQIQVSCTVRQGETRRSGRVDLELEAVELGDHRRRWLLVEALFPGQRPVPTGRFPSLLVALLALLSLPLVALSIWRRHRARRALRELRPA